MNLYYRSHLWVNGIDNNNDNTSFYFEFLSVIIINELIHGIFIRETIIFEEFGMYSVNKFVDYKNGIYCVRALSSFMIIKLFGRNKKSVNLNSF